MNYLVHLLQKVNKCAEKLCNFHNFQLTFLWEFERLVAVMTVWTRWWWRGTKRTPPAACHGHIAGEVMLLN